MLLSYFARRAIPVRLLDPAAAAQADMVFQSVERDWQARFCLRAAEGGKQINFSLRAPDDTRWRDKPRCISESGVIFRNDTIGLVLSRVEQALALQTSDSEARRCYWCERQRITPPRTGCDALSGLGNAADGDSALFGVEREDRQ